jgi:hypothetical protein
MSGTTSPWRETNLSSMSCIPGHTPADASDGVTRQAPRERKSLGIGILK